MANGNQPSMNKSNAAPMGTQQQQQQMQAAQQGVDQSLAALAAPAQSPTMGMPRTVRQTPQAAPYRFAGGPLSGFMGQGGGMPTSSLVSQYDPFTQATAAQPGMGGAGGLQMFDVGGGETGLDQNVTGWAPPGAFMPAYGAVPEGMESAYATAFPPTPVEGANIVGHDPMGNPIYAGDEPESTGWVGYDEDWAPPGAGPAPSTSPWQELHPDVDRTTAATATTATGTPIQFRKGYSSLGTEAHNANLDVINKAYNNTMSSMAEREHASRRNLREIMAGAGLSGSEHIVTDQAQKLTAHWAGQQSDAELAMSQAMNNENNRFSTQMFMEDEAYRTGIDSSVTEFINQLENKADAKGKMLNEKFYGWMMSEIEELKSMNADPSFIKAQFIAMQRFFAESEYNLFVSRDSDLGSYEEGEMPGFVSAEGQPGYGSSSATIGQAEPPPAGDPFEGSAWGNWKNK